MEILLTTDKNHGLKSITLLSLLSEVHGTILETVHHSNSKIYEEHYCFQAEHCLSDFAGRSRIQGRGLGSLPSGIRCLIFLFFKRGGKALLKYQRTGVHAAQDELSGTNVKITVEE